MRALASRVAGRLGLVAALLAPPVAAPGAHAQALSIGLASPWASLDPLYFANTQNFQVTFHIFDPLIGLDTDSRFVPALFESWTTTSPTEWRITLRQGVRFHDGAPFTAADVAATIRRAARLTGPSPYSTYVRPITSVAVVDDYTLLLGTAEPFPLLPRYLAQIGAISARFEEATTEDFNAGRAAIGTGPYRHGRYTPGDRVEMTRNEAWWGGRPHWERVTLRVLANDATREATLLSGEVDLIEKLSPIAVARLSEQQRLRVVGRRGGQLIYLGFDHANAESPGVVADGRRNPFQDRRVREAVSLAIDRGAIVARLLSGFGTPHGQLVVEGMPGFDPALTPDATDLARARALLAEAGFPNGFTVSLVAPNDRFLADDQVAQAVAGMLTRIGIRTRVEARPFSVFVSGAVRGRRLEGQPGYSLYVNEYGNALADASAPLRALLARPDPRTGFGSQNWGYYSNPALERLLDASFVELDGHRREALLREAGAEAMRDRGIIPLYVNHGHWAMRRGIDYRNPVALRTQAHWAVPAE
jgi:peptide/nickel transport system substrate-binding protein